MTSRWPTRCAASWTATWFWTGGSAKAGRYPAVDVLRSLSRAASGCLDPAQTALVREARAMLALHADMADMVRLGAVRPGADPALDRALQAVPRIEAMLRQTRDEATGIAASFAALRAAMGQAA